MIKPQKSFSILWKLKPWRPSVALKLAANKRRSQALVNSERAKLKTKENNENRKYN